MKYALGCAFNLPDMFMNLNLKRLDITCDECGKLIGDRHRDRLAQRIFKSCFKLVIEDIVKNNVTFWFPLNGIRCCNMHMARVQGKDFQRLRRAGKWRDVDFIKSFFTGYEIRLFLLGKRTPRVKTVYLNKLYRDQITVNTNNGKNYGDSKNDTYLKDYLKNIYKLYPKVPKRDIQIILKFGFKSLYLHNSYGGDTLIRDNDFWCYIGKLKKKPLDHFYYYIRKLTVKLRVLYKRKKIPWDGYYYFGLTDKQYQNYLSQRRKKYIHFYNVVMYKLYEECSINEFNRRYIFRIPYITYFNYKIFNKELVTNEAELYQEREILKFKDISVYDNKYEIL